MVTRIRELLEYKNLTPTQFADLIGVGRPVMSHILSERNKPSLEVVQRIISAFPEISLPWLLSGTGEMLAAGATVPPVAATEEVSLPVAAGEPATSSLVSDAPAAPPVAIAATAPAAITKPVPSVASSPATPGAAMVAASPEVAPLANAAPVAIPSVPKPFRASRTVPPKAEPPLPPSEAVAAALPAPILQVAEPATTAPTRVAYSASATPSVPEAAMLPFLAEPGKAIRRIVIFYRDGSFADYQPEQ